MAWDSGLLISAFFMGLLGSTHCVGMCGGISAALSFALPAEKRQGLSLVGYQLSYNLGRIATYTLLGAIIGLLGSGLLAPWQHSPWPRVLAGLFMLVLGLYLAGWWLGLQKLERVGGGLWKYIQPITQRLLPVNNPFKAVVAGGLWGFLPCGLVYSALGLALARAEPGASAASMLAFGLGTLPTLLLTGSLAGRLRELLQQTRVRQLAGVLVMAFGLWTAIPALLHGDHSGQPTTAIPEDYGQGLPTTAPPAMDHHEHHHH